MRKDKSKAGLYFIQLNLQKEKHAGLIEWIKKQAELNEQSLSAFCISILKTQYTEGDNDGDGKSEQ
jgi:hypothetical protein